MNENVKDLKEQIKQLKLKKIGYERIYCEDESKIDEYPHQDTIFKDDKTIIRHYKFKDISDEELSELYDLYVEHEKLSSNNYKGLILSLNIFSWVALILSVFLGIFIISDDGSLLGLIFIVAGIFGYMIFKGLAIITKLLISIKNS